MKKIVLSILFVCLPLSFAEAQLNFQESIQSRVAELTSAIVFDGDLHQQPSSKYPRPDTHAPCHLMGAHLHEIGEKMIEYKYMNMSMSGLQQGTDNIDVTQILDEYPIDTIIVPQKMNMEMHMLHYMVGWKENITFYVMPMWVVNTMEVTPYIVPGEVDEAAGNVFQFPNQRRTNSGFGDLPFGALWKFHHDEDKRSEWILNIGLSAPTGDIDGKTASPVPGSMMPVEFPYPMRLGTGSWMARPGLTYRRYTDTTSLGVQLQADIALAKGAGGYAASDKYRLSGWFSKIISDDRTWAYTLRIEGLWVSDYRGVDPQLEVMEMAGSTMAEMNPAANGAFQGGRSLNFGYGIIKSLSDGSRVNLEITHPVYQNLNGIQMGTGSSVAVSWSKAY